MAIPFDLFRISPVGAIPVDCCISVQKVVSNTYTVMLNAKSQNPGVVSLQELCDGLGITLRQFFDDDLFENIEQEIK